MSNRREAVIERRYEPDEGACVRAVEILLKSVRKEGGSATAPNDAERIPSDGATTILQD